MSVSFYVQGSEVELNVNNQTARMLFELIGVETDELVGQLSVKQVRAIAEKADSLGLTRGANVSQTPGHAKIIDCGMSLDRLRNYSRWFSEMDNEAEKLETYLITYS